MQWTLLRSGFFYGNFAGMLGAGIKSGTVRFPDLSVAAVDPRDMGRVAAAVLAGGGDPAAHYGRAYEISGPEMLQVRDVVSAIAAAVGRPLAFEPVPVAALAAFLPPFLVEVLSYMEARGAAAVPHSDDTMRIAGEHTTFAAWLAEHTALFRL